MHDIIGYTTDVYLLLMLDISKVLDELMCSVNKNDGLSLSAVYHLLTAHFLKPCES
jgi:hypothetical protein